MNWTPIKRTFIEADGSLDEIVLAVFGLILAGLVLEFRTYWNPAAGTPPFNLKDFGEGMATMALGAGAWWKLRSMSATPPPTQHNPQP